MHLYLKKHKDVITPFAVFPNENPEAMENTIIMRRVIP